MELLCTIIPLKRLHAVTESLNLLHQSVMGWCNPLAPSSFDAGKVTRLSSASSLMDFAALHRIEYTSVLFLPYQKSFLTRKRLCLCLSLSLLLYFPFFSGVATVMNRSYNLMILIKQICMNLIFCDLPMSISNHSPNMLYKDTPLCVQPPLYQQIVSSVLWKRHFAFPVKEFSEVTCNYCLLIFWNLISMLRIICVRCQETIFTTDL